MGGYQHIKRADRFPFGFQCGSYFPIARNQSLALTGKNRYENGKLKPSKPQTDHQTIARNTMKKKRKIIIRISENDLSALQRRAAREGIPYQTLIGSVHHKYASGFLKGAR